MSRRTDRALVLVHDEGTRDQIRGYLREFGFDVLVFDDGDDFLEAVQDNSDIDIVVIDALLHGQSRDGLEVCNEMRRRDIRIPALFISGDPDQDLVRAVKKLGPGHDFLGLNNLSAEIFFNYCGSLVQQHKMLMDMTSVKVSVGRIEQSLAALDPKKIVELVKAEQLPNCEKRMDLKLSEALSPAQIAKAFGKDTMFRIAKWAMVLLVGGYGTWLMITYGMAMDNRDRSIRAEEQIKYVQKTLKPLMGLSQAQKALNIKMDKVIDEFKGKKKVDE